MSNWKAKRERMDAALKLRAVPLLRQMGFKGTFPHFRRVLTNRVDAIGFQFSQWGPQFYIELGVSALDGTLRDRTQLSAKSLKYYQCVKRKRIGELPFDFESKGSDSVAEQAYVAIADAKEEWESLYSNLTPDPGSAISSKQSHAPKPRR